MLVCDELSSMRDLLVLIAGRISSTISIAVISSTISIVVMYWADSS